MYGISRNVSPGGWEPAGIRCSQGHRGSVHTASGTITPGGRLRSPFDCMRGICHIRRCAAFSAHTRGPAKILWLGRIFSGLARMIIVGLELLVHVAGRLGQKKVLPVVLRDEVFRI